MSKGRARAESVGVSREGGDVEKEKMACVEREQSKRGRERAGQVKEFVRRRTAEGLFVSRTCVLSDLLEAI